VLRVRTTLHLAIAAVHAAASALGATRPASAAASTGFLDRTPGGDGTLLTNVAGGDSADAVATRADGKIVVAGTSSGSPPAGRSPSRWWSRSPVRSPSAVVKLLVMGTSFIDVGQRDSVAAKVRIS